MTDLALHIGLQLERPVGTDWCRELKARQLLKLQKGELLFFQKKDDKLECVTITQPSQTLDSRDYGHRLHGIQVFFSGRTISCSPHLVKDGLASGLYRFIDLDAAWLHYHKPMLAAVPDEASVRSLGGGG